MVKFSIEKLSIALLSSLFTCVIISYSNSNIHESKEDDLLQALDSLSNNPVHQRLSVKDKSNIKWCSGYLRYLDPPGPLTALASYPGSGNTWLRYLLQQATGIVTGSVYNSAPLKQSAFPAEGIFNGSVLAIKTHVGRKPPPNPLWPVKFDRVIVLVRDPFQALLAEFNRQQSHNQTGFAADEKFESEWSNYLQKSMDFWKGFHMYFKSEYKPFQVIFITYESLQKDLIGQLRKILIFLGYTLPANMAKCVKNRQEGLFHRSKPHVDQLKYYNAEQKVVLGALRDEIYKKIGLPVPKNKH